jgi:N-acetylneuraminic acid mutarotase
MLLMFTPSRPELARRGKLQRVAHALSLLGGLSLASCGGGGGSAAPPATYTIGGGVAGLTAGGLVVTNGSDSVPVPASATKFTLPIAVTTMTSYNVAVSTQPTGLTCYVGNGTGTVSAANITGIEIDCYSDWTWVAGPSTPNGTGNYGTRGVSSADTIPGARYGSVTWTDGDGNLWLFGGFGFDSVGNYDGLNDLWMFSPTTLQWTWVGGSSNAGAPGTYGTRGTAAVGNVPGARSSAVSWTDTAGYLWLFGGSGVDSTGLPGNLNDLWKYSTATGLWTWVSGSSSASTAAIYGTQGIAAAGNVPSARSGASSWTDTAGNLWLFGGVGPDGQVYLRYLNDLWVYDPVSQLWTWISGSSAFEAAGDLWLFGGYGFDSSGVPWSWLNDLWTFSPTTRRWTWVGGSNTIAAPAVVGTQGIPDAANTSGAKSFASGWVDSAGRFWLFGGWGNSTLVDQNLLSELWMYDPAGQAWARVNWSSTYPPEFGAIGVPAASNTPGGRQYGMTWTDSAGKRWFFGGQGMNANPNWVTYNDMWRF